jgi:protein-disulfide isomerase
MARPTNTTGKKKNNVRPASTRPTGFYYVLGAIVLIGASILGYSMMRKPADVVATDAVTPVTPIGKAEGYLIGKPDAPVKILEFADFECPGCGNFANVTEPDVRKRLIETGLANMTFYDFPLPQHRNSQAASNAAACAADQGKFWEMHDAIYASQDRWDGTATKSPDKVLKQVAAQIPGIKADQFDQCVDTKKTQAKIQAHLKLAEARQIGATPTFIFGGDKQYPGFLTYDQFKTFVDSAIAKAATNPPTPAVGGDTAKKTAPLAPTKKNGND